MIKKIKFDGFMHNSEDDINKAIMTYLTNSDGTVRAIMNIENEELFLVPPGDDKEQTHKLYSEICNLEKVKYIDKSNDFNIAVPIDWYIEKAFEFNLNDRIEEAIKFKKNALVGWEKWKKENINTLKEWKENK